MEPRLQSESSRGFGAAGDGGAARGDVGRKRKAGDGGGGEADCRDDGGAETSAASTCLPVEAETSVPLQAETGAVADLGAGEPHAKPGGCVPEAGGDATPGGAAGGGDEAKSAAEGGDGSGSVERAAGEAGPKTADGTEKVDGGEKERQALVVSVTLRASTYATMFIRELLKVLYFCTLALRFLEFRTCV